MKGKEGSDQRNNKKRGDVFYLCFFAKHLLLVFGIFGFVVGSYFCFSSFSI